MMRGVGWVHLKAIEVRLGMSFLTVAAGLSVPN